MLEIDHLTVAYGDAVAVWDVSLVMGERELVTVVGPNGAGKTTLINALAGLLPIRAGTLRFDGVDLGRLPSHRFCRHGIALVPEGRRVFGGMTVEESLERVYGLFPILRERRRQLAGSLSGGEQQMLAIGRALMARPRLLLLDEPSLGLAPAVVDHMFEIIRAIHAEGVAILLVEQNVVRALEIADRAYVLEEGRVVADGPPSALRQQSRIREAYLGLRESGGPT